MEAKCNKNVLNQYLKYVMVALSPLFQTTINHSEKWNKKFMNSGYDKGRLQTFIEVFDNILGSIREPFMVLDSDLKVVKANRSFYQTFNVKPDETEGLLIYDLGNRQFVDFYIKKISKRLGRTIEIIPASVMNALQDYHWPGNIRELENVLERVVINSSGPKLRLVDELKKPFKDLSASQKTLEAVERDYIVKILEQTRWKVGGKNSAAEILGLDRSTLRARMRKLNIQKP